MSPPAVVITGAAGGIGTALCERMRADGYIAIGIDLIDAPSADVSFLLDLREPEAVVNLGRQLAREHELKAVIHNAAVQPIAGAGETSLSEWWETVRVNLLAVDLLVCGTRESLGANQGSIVVVSSVHARATTGGLTAYSATKAALEGWVRSSALDLGPEIRVNAVSPGAIDTPKLREGFARWGEEVEQERLAVLRRRTALRRIGDASDVAGAASFLIGDDARFVTGCVLAVDGGAAARLGSE